MSNKKTYVMKKMEKNYYENKSNRYINYEELLRPHSELEKKLKALEENFMRNESENNQNI